VSWSCAAALLAVVLQTQTPPPRTPPRDVGAPAATGTATIKGRVISLDGERPLRRARVVVSSPQLTEGRSTSTDSLGVYEFTDLPAGRYTVSVNRSGYLPLRCLPWFRRRSDTLEADGGWCDPEPPRLKPDAC
jgi:hypothetical protein